MEKQHQVLDFIIDKLTNSIEKTLTSVVFNTKIVILNKPDAKQIKKADWKFDWHKEPKDETKKIFKLTTTNNPTITQGLLSIEDKQYHILCTWLKVQSLIKKQSIFRRSG